MKKKLKITFILIFCSMLAIVIFQFYWTLNAYQVNKNRFSLDADLALQRAIDDCRKDYFDSIRPLMVKRLSLPLASYRLDTIQTNNAVPAAFSISLYDGPTPPPDSVQQPFSVFFVQNNKAEKQLNSLFNKEIKKKGNADAQGALQTNSKQFTIALKKYTFQQTQTMDPVFTLRRSEMNLYRAKINHPATIPQLVTELSFYRPDVWQKLYFFFTQQEMHRYNEKPRMESLVLTVLPNYKKIDSVWISRHLTAELKNMNIYSPFKLNMDTIANRPVHIFKDSALVKTSEFSYKYHGWLPFKISTTKELYVRAVFENAGFAILRRMIITVALSILLVILTTAGFLYTLRIILFQKKLSDLKDDFINNMTHELKTPIATIAVAVEAMQNFNALNDPEKTSRYLQTSHEQLERLNQLVSKVLNIATFEHKQIELHYSQFDFDGLIKKVIDAEEIKSDKELEITFVNTAGIQNIYADELHFRNVMVNLLDNAVKYSGNQVSVKFSCYRNQNTLFIAVKDNGIGISAANQLQVFDKFYRVPTGNVHNVKGTGLGLSYAKYIIEAHGGTITVKSELHKGTAFIVSLPLSNG